jgi:hypothetical protein
MNETSGSDCLAVKFSFSNRPTRRRYAEESLEAVMDAMNSPHALA